MPNKQHCLAKGGKPFIAKNAGPSAEELAVEDNSRQVEGVQAWFKTHVGGFAPEFMKHIVSMEPGLGKDGQFRVTTEDAKVRMPEKWGDEILVEKYRSEVIVPARFLRKSGRAVNCPDLIKVGAAIEWYSAKGCGSVQKAHRDVHAPTYRTAIYNEIQFVLPAEKEAEWVSLGYMRNVSNEIDKGHVFLLNKRPADDKTPVTVIELMRSHYNDGSAIISSDVKTL